MWAALKEILVSGNAIYLLIFALIVLLLAIILLKKGLISVNTKSIKIGASESTRHLLQSQIELVNARFAEAEANLPSHLDNYRTKFVICRAIDVLERACVFNNMDDSEIYVTAKCSAVFATVLQLTDDPYFRTPEFRDFCYRLVADLIRDLVRMKAH